MQEEVEGRTVNLAISTSKLTARTIVIAVRSYMNHRKSAAVKGRPGAGSHQYRHFKDRSQWV